jgi:hypothetical protein
MEVFVLGDNREAVILRILPNRAVGRPRQSYVNDVRAIGICVSKLASEASRKILVKKDSIR